MYQGFQRLKELKRGRNCQSQVYNISSSLLFLCSLLLGDYKGAKLFYSFHPHPNPLPSRAREGICGVLPLKAREEKERGFIRGNSFPLILRKTLFLPQ